MHSFTIKDLENLSGIKAHTIRIWEQRYQFLKPGRTDTNIRYYTCEELKKLLNVALLNKYGYKISHIDKMCEAELQEKLLLLTMQEAMQERIVSELVQSMISLNMDELEEKMNRYIDARGIEKTISQIIFPFLEKIGLLWLTNHINPAQEHLVTNFIRQKMIVGIDQLPCNMQSVKSVLLFLPEGEFHEIGLLIVHYLLKCRGVKVIYLGANIALKDVEYVARLKKPTYLFTHLTSVTNKFNFDQFLSDNNRKPGGSILVVSGQLTQSYQKKIPPAIRLKRSFDEVLDFVNSI